MGLLYSHYEANPVTNNNINAVSGTLVKTFKKSYFITCEFGSYLAKGLFDKEKPNLGYQSVYSNYARGNEVVVLQTMLCGENRLLVEVINKEDYDKIFNLENKGGNNEK